MNPITINYLKELFLEKYEDSVFLTQTPPQVKVILTRKQYNELNRDFAKMVDDPISMAIQDEESGTFNQEEILYTKISILGLCEFNVELGENFKLCLVDESQEYGDETL